MPAGPRFSVSVHHGPFLLVVAVGRARLADLKGLIDMCAAITRTQPYSRILLDYTTLEAEIDDADRVSVGLYAARSLSHLSRAAAVVRAADFTGVAQSTAREALAGTTLDLRVFVDLREATEWLSET